MLDRRGFLKTGALYGIAGLGGATAAGAAATDLAGARPPVAGLVGTARSSDPIRLNANENPLGLSDAARQAVGDALNLANRYPGAQRNALVARLAEHHGVSEANVVMGAGSTEVLQMAVQAFHGPRARLIVADPTFEDVPRYQENFPYEMVRVPLTADHAHDIGRMREAAMDTGRPAVVYVCNPNNPTGTVTPSDDVEAWIADAPDHVCFLLDEAYIDYVDDPRYRTGLPWIHRRANVIVVRTFSKIYGMAGLRLGYGLAHPDTARRLSDFIMSNNANQLAIAAAMASLGDAELTARSLDVNTRARTLAQETLDELGLAWLPSQTNFLMHEVGGDVREYIDRMAAAGIGVGRPFPPMLDHNRLSFGLPEEMGRWAETIRGFRRKGWV